MDKEFNSIHSNILANADRVNLVEETTEFIRTYQIEEGPDGRRQALTIAEDNYGKNMFKSLLILKNNASQVY